MRSEMEQPTQAEKDAYCEAYVCDENDLAALLESGGPELLRRSLRAIAAGQLKTYGTLHDPIEDEPALREAFRIAIRAAEDEVPEQFKEVVGAGHFFWGAQARILRERFGIVWFNPAQMNPNALFD